MRAVQAMAKAVTYRSDTLLEGPPAGIDTLARQHAASAVRQ
jgi:hypothetical protein